MRRKQFLQEFLGALGAKDIHWNEETESSISGIVIYNFDDPEEIQEFIWHKHDSEAPTQEVLELATLLKAQRLLSIDKIMVSRQQLRQRFSTWLGRIVPEAEFLDILEALESVEVPMVDEGRETDIYFIHE
jgi:hypothetical protein